jgi:hypothetical protein
MLIGGLVTSCILFNSVSHASVVTTYFNVENESKATLCAEAGPEWFDVSETFSQSHNIIISESNSTCASFKLSIVSVFATVDGGFFALFLGAGRVVFRKNNKCEVRC